MPGLIGIVQPIPKQDVRSVFEKLLVPMQRGGRLDGETRIASDERWALGRVHLGTLQPAPQLDVNDSVQVLFHGDLSNEAELRKQLQLETCPRECEGISPLIKALYRTYGRAFASRLKGSFCAVVLDETLKQVALVNDYLGSYPLYWFNGPQRFIFASELKAILRDPGVNRVLDPRAVSDYLTYGFLFGNKTLAAQVSLLPPASTLTYCWEDGSCMMERYFHLDQFFKPLEESHTEYLEELNQAFNCSVERALEVENGVGLSLSGGLDSRAILSAIDGRRAQISTYTLGVRGCADEVIAEKLARIAGTEHQFLELDTRYLTDGLASLRRIVSLTDGMYLTHGLTEGLALQFLEKAGISVLLRGHGGELAKASLAWPLHTDEHIYHMRSEDEFVSYMLERINYISRGVSFRELFQDEWFEQIEGQAQLSLESSIADVRLSPPDLCSYLYLTEQHRRFTIPSLELFRNFAEVRMPFVDEDFLRVLFRCPAQCRDGTDIHRAIIKANNPSLLRVRNSNTGAPGDAGPIAEKILDKVNSLFRRVNLYGYRHYHSFQRWMKEMLLDSIQQVILHPESLARGIYRKTTLQRLIEETKRGVGDYAYLLQILLILELWQRENS
jgi:asparagine synthase (glutamine-hydrolysing)